MGETADIVLVMGSGPNARDAEAWPRARFDALVAINNAWRVRPDWTHLIYPEDFPEDRGPAPAAPGVRVTAADYVPIQNGYGGFVYAGGTMAFTAGYWALGALRPRVIGFIGCDMVYPAEGATHFYGTGQADPLRADITLRDLEAKSARLFMFAAMQGCLCVNLSTAQESRLVFPRATLDTLHCLTPTNRDTARAAAGPAIAEEARLGYMVASGRYWESTERFDPAALDRLDRMWRAAHRAVLRGGSVAVP